MFSKFPSRTVITGLLAAPALFGASLVTSGAALAAGCTGPGAPTNTETKCLKAVLIPGNPLQSYDISWVNPHRAEYYLGDRSNAGIDIIDTRTLTFKRTLKGNPAFKGVVLQTNATTGVVSVNNDKSGPDGVVSHGKWLYAGDGDSTLKVFDLDAPNASAHKQTIATGTADDNRVDEMALTTDGEFLLTVNNASEPPFATLFRANGDRHSGTVSIISKITIAGNIPAIEQPTWDPKTKRFYVSVPIVGGNHPTDPNCKVGPPSAVTCDGGLLVIDPAANLTATTVLGAFDPAKNVGLVKLSDCGPNGATVGPHGNLLLGCTQANNPANRSTLVINAATKHFSHVNGIVGSDEVWFNKGDGRYYTGSNRNCGTTTVCPAQAAVLGVIDGTSVLIETIPQSSGSHSVAADSKRNLIFVPQNAPAAVFPAGTGGNGDTTDVGAGICGTANNATGTGCIAVYSHHVDRDRDDHDRDDRDHGDHDH